MHYLSVLPCSFFFSLLLFSSFFCSILFIISKFIISFPSFSRNSFIYFSSLVTSHSFRTCLSYFLFLLRIFYIFFLSPISSVDFPSLRSLSISCYQAPILGTPVFLPYSSVSVCVHVQHSPFLRYCSDSSKTHFCPLLKKKLYGYIQESDREQNVSAEYVSSHSRNYVSRCCVSAMIMIIDLKFINS